MKFITHPKLPHVDGLLVRREGDLSLLIRAYQQNLAVSQKEGELYKTTRDKKVIASVLSHIADSMRAFGRQKDLALPLQNVRLFPEGGVERHTKEECAHGAYASVLGEVLVDRRSSDAEFAIALFHEIWHAKCFNVLARFDDGSAGGYRSGFGMTSLDAKTKYFLALDEGLTGFMTSNFFDSVLSKEEPFASEIRGNERTFDTTREKYQCWVIALAKNLHIKADLFRDQYEPMDWLIRAQVTGRWLPVARAIEHAFGNGGFRKLAESTAYTKKEL